MANKRRLIILPIAMGLAGCPLGTPNDHHRPHGHQDTTIDVSPADDAIVFNAKGDGGRDLYLLRLSDLSVSRIARTDDYELTPTFSPHGTMLTYAAGISGDRADHIFTISSDGSGRKQLTDSDANDMTPAYSPDGTMIAFARDKTYVWGGLAANWDHGGVICVVNSDGTNERQLTPDDTFAYAPRFSTDGKSVLFCTASGLFSVPVAGGASATRIGPGGLHLDLSSDGATTVFTDGKYSPDHEIFLSTIDGTQKTRLTSSPDGCFHPVFAESGGRVYFLIEEWPDGPTGPPKSSIWTVTLEGKDQKQLTDLSLFDDPMTWKPPQAP